MTASGKTTTLERTTAVETGHHHDPSTSLSQKIIFWVWHLLQMVIAMQVGMALYMVFADHLAPASYRAAAAANPLFDFWMMMAAMTVPMLLLMWYHKYNWRYCLGMTLAMLAPVAFLTLLTQADLLSLCGLHCNGQTAMLLGMAIFMFFRRQ